MRRLRGGRDWRCCYRQSRLGTPLTNGRRHILSNRSASNISTPQKAHLPCIRPPHPGLQTPLPPLPLPISAIPLNPPLTGPCLKPALQSQMFPSHAPPGLTTAVFGTMSRKKKSGPHARVPHKNGKSAGKANEPPQPGFPRAPQPGCASSCLSRRPGNWRRSINYRVCVDGLSVWGGAGGSLAA